MSIIFIGMSGSGKTHWSKLLAEELGVRCYEFDEIIGNSPEMSALLENIEGEDNAEKMGHYFGMPWTDGFEAKEENYLAIERKVMSSSYPSGSVLDQTGSAIYHPDALGALAKTSLVIYLETSEDKQKEMFETYISDPKPVCWGGVFQPLDGESNEAALERCYPELLRTRAALYKKYADITVPYNVHQKAKSIKELMSWIKSHADLCDTLSPPARIEIKGWKI